jgi:hypothetical protein
MSMRKTDAMRGSPAGVCLFVFFVIHDRLDQRFPQAMTAAGIRKSLDRAAFLNYINSKL